MIKYSIDFFMRSFVMTENILIAIAWPYANADIHVGNITGSHLPGDIVARYHRARANCVDGQRLRFAWHSHHN